LPADTVLPVPRTSFVGRAAELARAGQLLGQARLLTLLGPGGCGKTRLAIRLAAGAKGQFPGGCFFADLGPLDRAARVIGRVAESVGVDEPEGGGPVSEAICQRLAAGPSLLVLDSCEHVVDGAAEVTAILLAGAPDLTILATSREPLAVDGEVTWTVPAMAHADAVRLFGERAALAHPDRPPGADDEKAMGEVCRRLDGLPLAIELAAARTRALSPGQIAAGLDRRFELLANGPRTVPARHATLRASMDWSYELLGEHERALLRHLGVFAGGFGLDAVAAVHPAATAARLAALVDRSLVAAEDADGGSRRYRLLETVRAYALEQLATGEAGRARSRHRDYYLALAETAEPMISGPDQQKWLDRLAPDHDNVVAALTFSRDQADAELLARLAVAMTPYWLERSQWTECRVWLDAAQAADGIQPELRAQVLTCLCYLETWLGRLAVVPGLAGEALALARAAGARREEGRAVGYLAVITALAAGADEARPYFDQAAAIARSGSDSWGVANLLTFFSLARLFQADPGEVRRLMDEAVTAARSRGDGRSLRLASAVAAVAAATQGRLGDAERLATGAVEAGRRARHWSAVIVGQAAQGWLRIQGGDFDGAVAASSEGVEVARESGEPRFFQALAMSVCGWAHHCRGEVDDAVKTLGEAAELMRNSELPRWAGLPLVLLAHAQLDAGHPAAAQTCLAEATSVASAAGYPWILGRVEQARARLLAGSGDHEAAEIQLHQALALHQQAGDVTGQCDSLDELAAACAARDHPDVALRLWAAAQAARAGLGYSGTGYRAAARETAIAAARHTAGTAAQNHWAEGAGLSVDEAIAYAGRHRGKRGRPATGWASLTPTELQVVRLVGQHLSNTQIAGQLFMSHATVKTHLVHIFRKLGITSRSQLAAEAIRHQHQ
jgi:predicted ATPase/DNA-binding CsgD family transcriptional regulator